ncbi:MAG: hypothetical protein JXB62_02100 [Pirellulales bacterium]|nr:hypothetical protein [Pirellulales bacterium]
MRSRDARVDATDMLLARNNQTHFLNALKLIRAPAADTAIGEGILQKEATRIVAGTPEWLYELATAGSSQKPSRKTADGIDQLLAAGLL